MITLAAMTTTTALTESDVEVFISKLKQAGEYRKEPLPNAQTCNDAHAADNDKKVDLIQAFGLQLEETSDLPLATLDALTLLVSPLLKSTSHLLISAVLTSFIPFFIPFLPASPAAHLQIALHQLLPLLLEKLNDPKERIQSAARTSVALLGKKAYEAEPASALGGSTIKGKEKEGAVGYWERNVKEAMAGKGWRGKVECMKMLLIMRGEDKSRLSLKPWLAPLVDLLEDGDGNVRDQAREVGRPFEHPWGLADGRLLLRFCRRLERRPPQSRRSRSCCLLRACGRPSQMGYLRGYSGQLRLHLPQKYRSPPTKRLLPVGPGRLRQRWTRSRSY